MIRRYRFVWTSIFFCLCSIAAPARALGPNLLVNASFEDASDIVNVPAGWSRQGFALATSLTLDSNVAHSGFRSARIALTSPNDAAWTQTIALEPDRNYLFSGWIKTEGVAAATQGVETGASLSLWNTGQRSAPVTGTTDWTYMRMVFNSGPAGTVTLGARVGQLSGLASGTAWFDDLRVSEIPATDPHPSWKILVLIYDGTDFTYADESGEHHLVGHVAEDQLAVAAANATRFVQTDIPALTSGNMVPELTIRYPGTLRSLSPIDDGWWPSPADTASDRDPAFDSVIAIWQPTVLDQATGQSRWIGTAAGLAPAMGTGQTYATMIIEAASVYLHLNVFKHEWGHSLLSYYDAAGTAPRPTVSNHAESTDYVNCSTGQLYVWEDEIDGSPIPDSIYNNDSGFTHDYYSGTTALASDPLRCLGIPPAVWATGGPVSMPGELDDTLSAGDKIEGLRALLDQLAATGALRLNARRQLANHLDRTAHALDTGNMSNAANALTLFTRRVRWLRSKGRISDATSDMLMTPAGEIMESVASAGGP